MTGIRACSGTCRPRRPPSCWPSPASWSARSWHRGPAAYEADSRFPREVFRTLGKAGLLGLPYPEEHGGGGQPYEVYLQVVEELATVWASVAEGVSVHTLACFPLADVRHRRAAGPVAAGHGRAASCSAPTACPSPSPAPTRPP